MRFVSAVSESVTHPADERYVSVAVARNPQGVACVDPLLVVLGHERPLLAKRFHDANIHRIRARAELDVTAVDCCRSRSRPELRPQFAGSRLGFAAACQGEKGHHCGHPHLLSSNPKAADTWARNSPKSPSEPPARTGVANDTRCWCHRWHRLTGVGRKRYAREGSARHAVQLTARNLRPSRRTIVRNAALGARARGSSTVRALCPSSPFARCTHWRPAPRS